MKRGGCRAQVSPAFWTRPTVQCIPSLVLIFVAAGCSGGRIQDPEDPGTEDFEGRDGHYTVSSFQSAARGRVHFTVYLPPAWTPDGTEAYPLIIFLHGQTGDEFRFPDNVPVSDLNQWIGEGAVPPFVLIAPRGADEIGTVRWYHTPNVLLLTSDDPSELRAFCWRRFRAGGSSNSLSVHGHSRGASGALHFALNYPDKFASSVANAFVSDYVLEALKTSASENRERILTAGIRLRMIIGPEDSFVLNDGRIGSPAMHLHLDSLGIPHEYEVLPGVTHSFSSLWNYQRPDGLQSGLYELQFHARAWNGHPSIAGGPQGATIQ